MAQRLFISFLFLAMSSSFANAKFDPIQCSEAITSTDVVVKENIISEVEECAWKTLKNGETFRKFNVCLEKKLAQKSDKFSQPLDEMLHLVDLALEKPCT